jgi:hypothetical protein
MTNRILVLVLLAATYAIGYYAPAVHLNGTSGRDNAVQAQLNHPACKLRDVQNLKVP